VAIAASGSGSPALAEGAPGLLKFWRFEPPAAPLGKGTSTSTGCLPATLKAKLREIEGRFGPVLVVSTFRPGARIAGTRHQSLHASCRAVDFRPAGGTYGAVAAHLRQSWSGGVGTYASGHIHIDTGPGYQWHHGGGRKVAQVKRDGRPALSARTSTLPDRIASASPAVD
jgi:hypothetical protein